MSLELNVFVLRDALPEKKAKQNKSQTNNKLSHPYLYENMS